MSDLYAVIEIPQNSLLKYEFDKAEKALVVDRVLSRPVPFNYGFIPGTLAPDGDPLDAFVLGDIPIHPLARVKINILGIFKCIDNGSEDDKLVCSMGDYPFWDSDLCGRGVIQNYLETYKVGFKVLSYESTEVALKVLKKTLKAGLTKKRR